MVVQMRPARQSARIFAALFLRGYPIREFEITRAHSDSTSRMARPDWTDTRTLSSLVAIACKGQLGVLCRREGIVQNLYYRRSKDFLEAGKKRLAGDTVRAATSDEVKDLRREASALKEVVAELTLENRLLKKSVTADGEDAA
jgi:transposase